MIEIYQVFVLSVIIAGVSALVTSLIMRSKVKYVEGTADDFIKQIEKIEPKSVIDAVGAQIYESSEDRYVVGFQGGRFELCFNGNNRSVGLTYFPFCSCEPSFYIRALRIANEMNSNPRSQWRAVVYMDNANGGAGEVKAYLRAQTDLAPSVEVSAMILQDKMAQAFEVARCISNDIEECVSKQSTFDNEDVTQKIFLNKLHYTYNLADLGKIDALGDEYPENDALDLSNIMSLYANRMACLLGMRVINGDSVEEETDLNAIPRFNIRQYIKSQPDPGAVDEFTIVLKYENARLVVSVVKRQGSTGKHLFYNLSCMPVFENPMFNAANDETFGCCIEVRLTDAEKDYWEAKYMIDEALEGKNDLFTDEFKPMKDFVRHITDRSLRTDIYWAMKHYNNGEYLQAAILFEQAHKFITLYYAEGSEELRNEHLRLSYYIGNCYFSMRMFRLAFPYLAQVRGYLNDFTAYDCTDKFAVCLVELGMDDAIPFILEQIKKLQPMISDDEESAAKNDFLRHILVNNKKRLVVAYMKFGFYDEALKVLDDFNEADKDEDKEWAINYKTYLLDLKRQLEEEKNPGNSKTEEK